MATGNEALLLKNTSRQTGKQIAVKQYGGKTVITISDYLHREKHRKSSYL